MTRPGRMVRIALLGLAFAGATGAVLLLLWHEPTALGAVSLGGEPVRGKSPAHRVASWLRNDSSPRTPSVLVRLFQAHELAALGVLLTVTAWMPVRLRGEIARSPSTPKTTRFRFSLRSAMALVGLVALLAASEVQGRQHWVLRQKYVRALVGVRSNAGESRVMAALLRSDLAALQEVEAIDELSNLHGVIRAKYGDDLQAAIEGTRREIAWHDSSAVYFSALIPKYERAVKRPWVPVEPDPPRPPQPFPWKDP